MLSNSRRSLLFVLPWSPNLPGGVSVVVRNLSRELQDGNLRPIVIIDTWDSPHSRVDDEGTLNFRFALFGALTPIGLIKAAVTLPFRISTTLSFLRKLRVEAVDFHYPSLDAAGIALLKYLGLFKGRLVLSFHGTDVRRPSNRLEKALWKFIWKSVDGVTACSGALASQISEDFNVDVSRITVVYNGVDTVLFSPSSNSDEANAINLPKQYIVSIGSYIPRKGHAVLLEAFSSLAQDFPDLHLVIVGMDGPERKTLTERSLSLGLGGRLICLVGLIPEAVASVVANAAVCVQPSIAEPFGLAVIEAGACGTPVLASAVGGHLELITDQKTGLLFPAGDSAQCAALLRKSLNDLDGTRRLARSFRLEVLERYSWRSCAQGYLRLLEKNTDDAH